MLKASGLPEFNSSYLHIANFYKKQLLLLLVFQDFILQQYDAISLSNHILAFWCKIFSFSSGVKTSNNKNSDPTVPQKAQYPIT